MPDIFEYNDYRKYLADSYAEKKAKFPAFSYNNFSLRAGLKSKGFLHDVIHGKKALSKPTIVKIAQGLGLKDDEAQYFENLVFFNQASDLKERSYFFEKLQNVKPHNSDSRKVQEVRKDQYEFYSKWYHSAIRSLVGLFPVKDNYEWLAKKVFPPITPTQARKSIELLEKLGFIERREDGIFRLCDKSITTGKEALGPAILRFHLDAMELAGKCLQELPHEKRNISGLTLGISENAYRRICEEISQFQEKLMKIADDDEKADRVYRLNFHFFPISNEMGVDGKGQN